MDNKTKFFLLLMSGLFFAPLANAQTCAQSPSCAELGFTNTSSQCADSDMIKCPFDKTKVFCRTTKTCVQLGFTLTASQCTGRKTTTCPSDTTKVSCDTGNLIGEIKLWSGTTIPRGWAKCDGSSFAVSGYRDLYNVIRNTFGGDTVAFKVPDFRGRVPVGTGYVYAGTSYTYAFAETGGENFTQLRSDQIPDHKHISAWGENNGQGAVWGGYGSGKQGSSSTDWDNQWYNTSYMYSRTGYRSTPSSKTSGWGSAGSCASDRTYSCPTSYHENRMPYLSLDYIIYTGVYSAQNKKNLRPDYKAEVFLT